jgi:putative tryptophan/tyrosine transport system substrate-binding protein
MRRRVFTAGMGSAIAWSMAAHAQPDTLPALGILLVFTQEAGRAFTEPIRAYMEALGYVEGRNIAFDFRFADGSADRLPALAAELAARHPKVIATFGDAAGLAAKGATTAVPIVSMSEDLVRARIVDNLRRPGGNITGLSIMGTELDAKRLEILAELLPPRSTVLLLADPTTHRESRPAIDRAATALGLTLRESIVGTPDEVDRALREAKASGVGGVNVLASALLFALRARIIARAAEIGVPAMYQWPETAEEGGLVAYGPSLHLAFRQVTALVDRILRGARPGEIPVEQPSQFSLFLNLRTARALGLRVPAVSLLRADRVIQ